MSTTQDFGRQETNKEQYQKPTSERQKGQESKNAQLVNALQLIKSGVRLQDLSTEQMTELAELAGNQTVLELFQSGCGSLPLAKLPAESKQESSELPVNEVETRWPALSTLPETSQIMPAMDSVWPVEQIRPMGAYEGGPVIC